MSSSGEQKKVEGQVYVWKVGRALVGCRDVWALAPVPSVAEAQGGGGCGGGNSEILREALRPKKCVEEASAVAQGRCARGQCVPTAQGQGRDVQGAFGECVAVSPSLWDLHA